MIEIFEGFLGGGKTLTAVSRIGAHVAKGGTVFTNIEIRWGHWIDDWGKPQKGFKHYVEQTFGVTPLEEQIVVFTEANMDTFHKDMKRGTGRLNVLGVLDEIHLWYNARDHQKTDKKGRGLLEMLSQSRKLFIDLIFIAQSAKNVDSQFVRQADYTWRFKDMAKFRMPVFGNMFSWFLKPFMIAIVFDSKSGQMLENKWVKKNKLVMGAYRTNAILRGIELPGEVASPFSLKRVSRVKRLPKFQHSDLWAVGAAVLFVAVTIWKLYQ